MMSCEEAVAELWRHLETDATLGGPAGARGADPDLDGHLARCRQCCGESEFAGMLREMWVSVSVDALPADVGGRFEDFLSQLPVVADVDGGIDDAGGAV